MVSYADIDYILTKQILLGKADIIPDFSLLADFVDQTFGVKTINIVYDVIEENTLPSLDIHFVNEQERASFIDNETGVYDRKKQKLIVDRFKEIVIEQGMINKYRTENMWAYFSAFKPIARAEANSAIPEELIKQLHKDLDCDDLWDISRCFAGITFFLYTDEQLKKYEISETRNMWADKYFDLLEPYNEFGYFNRDKFRIYLDSKENFDENYGGNWYYYYK